MQEVVTKLDVTITWDIHKRKIEFNLLKEYTFHVDGLTLVIPKGYQTDFASVPHFLWSFLPSIGKHNVAALVHDYLYDNRIGTRRNADFIFLQLMIEYKVNFASAFIMYLGVRIGGRKWWNN